MNKIYIIEDDEKLNRYIREYAERYDYEVYAVKDFRNIEAEFKVIKPNIVLLDINLPYYDGFYLCRVIRKSSNVPIIIISARTSEVEQVMGIELGADDYITKPFSLELLMVKIKAALRRVNGEYCEEKKECINTNGLCIDETSFKLSYMGRNIELTKNEFKIIKKLIENEDRIVTRDELLELLWDKTSFADDNTLTVNITRVKNKLKDINVTDTIKTKRGVGYIWEWGNEKID